MKKLCVASNMMNERPQLEGWLDFVTKISDYALVVDSGSTDGTIEYLEAHQVLVVKDDTIIREGYGPARNQLRSLAREHFPDAHWLLFLDADERIMPDDFHRLRFLKDYLIDDYDVLALPRVDWMNLEMTAMAKDWVWNPDYQARMTRLSSPCQYIRKIHEQIIGHRGMYADLENPKIHHFHRSAGQAKRDAIGKLCAFLHKSDTEYGHTVPEHHKEAMYREMLDKEGL